MFILLNTYLKISNLMIYSKIFCYKGGYSFSWLLHLMLWSFSVPGVKTRAGWWRFQVRFLLCPFEIFLKFIKTSGSLRENIFDKIYCSLLNNLIQKQFFIMQLIIHCASSRILKDTHVIICLRWRPVQFQKLFLDNISLTNLFYEEVNILPSWKKPVKSQ